MATEDTGPFPPDCAARFTCRRKIAAGGFGAVYEAEQVALGRPAAIKLLLADVLTDPEQVNRFDNEARITASIAHPNVIQVLDHGAAHGIPWIAYELVSGKSLRDLLEAGQLSLAEALEAGVQVADALAAAHARSVLHRDIKPDNVLLAGAGRYKVTDFGIAKWTSESAVKTRTGVIMGTPTYLAPEQIRGEPATPASDIYALGVMLFELTTGRAPYQADGVYQLMELHLRAEVPRASARNPARPRARDAVLEQALAKDPEKRPSSAAALSEALAHIINALRNPGRPAPPTERFRASSVAATVIVAPPASPARSRGSLAVAGGIGLLLVALAMSRRSPSAAVPVSTTPSAGPAVAASAAPRKIPPQAAANELFKTLDLLAKATPPPEINIFREDKAAQIKELMQAIQVYRNVQQATLAAPQVDPSTLMVFAAAGTRLCFSAATLLYVAEQVHADPLVMLLVEWKRDLAKIVRGAYPMRLRGHLDSLLDHLIAARKLGPDNRCASVHVQLDFLAARFEDGSVTKAELVAAIDFTVLALVSERNPVWFSDAGSSEDTDRKRGLRKLRGLFLERILPVMRGTAPPLRQRIPRTAALFREFALLATTGRIPEREVAPLGFGLLELSTLAALAPEPNAISPPLLDHLCRSWRDELVRVRQELKDASQKSGGLAAELYEGLGELERQSARNGHSRVRGRASLVKLHRKALFLQMQSRCAVLAARTGPLAAAAARSPLVGPLMQVSQGARELEHLLVGLEERAGLKAMHEGLELKSGSGVHWATSFHRAFDEDLRNDQKARVKLATAAADAFGPPPTSGHPDWSARWICWLMLHDLLVRAKRGAGENEGACREADEARRMLPRLHELTRSREMLDRTVELLDWRQDKCGAPDPYLAAVRKLVR